LLGLVITLGIICFMAYFLLNNYFKIPLSGQGIDNSNIIPGAAGSSAPYYSIVGSTKNTLESIEKERQKQLDAAAEQYKNK
jgi:hypothetical protein